MRSKLSGLFIFICLLAFIVIALLLRIIPPYSQVFTGGWVKFTSPDVYYFMRQVDHLVYNFPNLMPVDPYFSLAGGGGSSELNFFEYLISAVTLLVGAGSHTPELIDLVGMYFPVVLGALTLIPGYFLGRALFNKWGGLLTAGLLAVMPGEYLARTGLGATDRDCLQVFLVVVTMLFTVLAIKCAADDDLFTKSITIADRKAIVQASIYSLLAGISLGLFILTWIGAFIFSGIILIFLIVQSIIDCLKGRPAKYLFLTGTIIFVSAALVFWFFVEDMQFRAAIMAELIVVISAALVSWIVTKWRLRPLLYPIMLGVLGAIAIGLIFPGIFEGIKSYLKGSIYFGTFSQTISENLPILFPSGQFTLYALWVNYTTCFYLSLIGIALLVFRAIKDREAGVTFLLVWSIALLLLTLMMRRFAVFYTVNVALLSAYCCLKFFEYLGIMKPAAAKQARQPIAPERSGRDKKLRSPSHGSAPVMSVILGVLPVLLLVFLPNIPTAVFVSGTLPYVPSNGWCESLDWLKNNTPDPYGNHDFYYADYSKAVSANNLNPDSAYAVTAWWDYGYWIIRTGHRLPNCHPGGGHRDLVAKFFVGQDMESAYKQAKDLRSKYVMLNHDTVTTMYDSVLLYAGMDRTNYFDGYYRPIAGTSQLEPIVLYHPEYYRSLAVRLYNFDGAAVIPQSCQVISWEERMSVEGSYKHLTSNQTFHSYQEAVKYIDGQKTGNYLIASDDPFKSPVPLAPVSGYRLAYSSDGKVKSAGGTEMPEVKVFEYIK